MSLVCTELSRSKSLRACLLGVLTLAAGLAVSAQAVITTVAGGYVSSPGPSLNACLPAGSPVLQGGYTYVASCQQVYKIDALGAWTLVAGTGEAGFSGDGGLAIDAKLGAPGLGVAVDGLGNVFILDHINSRIREVDAGTNIIHTIAGTGTPGYNGDNIPAIDAQIGSSLPNLGGA